MIFQTRNGVQNTGLKGAARALALGLPAMALLGALCLSCAQPARADSQLIWEHNQRQIDVGHYTLTSIGGGRWLVRNRQTGETHIVREHSADRDRQAWGGDHDRHGIPGQVWHERESGWDGVWRRHGDSNAFDARWNGPTGGWAAANLHMRIDDSGRVRIDRHDTSNNLDCQYIGEFSDGDRDQLRVSGIYQCSNGSGIHSWSARIER